jgi:UDP-N-acetyl-D-galactosamine dehydrogenase
MTEIRVVGMGFVGIPLAVAFDDAGHDVVGFDIDEDRVRQLGRGRDPTREVADDSLRETGAEFTSDPSALAGFDYAVVTVPTPVDEWRRPVLDMIAAAGRTVGDHLQPGATVVLESTVYPGGTREVLVPALETASGLDAGGDFGVGYSPERIAPGPGDSYSLRRTNKLVSATDEQTLSGLLALYESIIEATVHPVASIETAEAAKCLENVQRDVNIALANEFVIGCRKLDVDLDPQAVLDAAGTKPAFHDYRPGLVGGHCIPVDPHLLAKRFDRSGFHSMLIESARRTNESFPRHVADQVAKHVPRTGAVAQADGAGASSPADGAPVDADAGAFRALVLGFAYKANVTDARNDALGTLVDELDAHGAAVEGCDPLVDDDHLADEFGVEPVSDPDFSAYDAVVVSTLHDEFREYELAEHVDADGLPYVVDLTGHFRRAPDPLSPEGNVS